MRFLFACGGSGGHINPALVIAAELRELFPDCAILFAGGKGNIETELVPRAGFEIKTVSIDNLRRGVKPRDLAHNVRAAVRTVTSRVEARRIIKNFKPDVVIGTGGYVCYPILKSASALGIPTVLHASDVLPGLTTRMLENHVSSILLGFDGSEKHYKRTEKITVTGTPVRSGFTARRGGERGEQKPFVLSMWGSLGAKYMNEQIPEFMRLVEADGSFRALHAAGTNSTLQPHKTSVTEIVRYIHDMPARMSEASLVICRAGANALCELAASATPSILVPSAYVTANHQEYNARTFEHAGAAVVILEKDATAEALFATAKKLLSDPAKLAEMSKAAKSMDKPDAADRIIGEILKYVS